MALAGGAASSPARAAGGRECDGGAGLFAQMGSTGAGRPASHAASGSRNSPDPAAEAQAIALALREALETPARRPRWSRRTGSSRPGGGAARALGRRSGRQRRPAALEDSRPGRCFWRSPPPLPKKWRRSHCSPCSSIRWSAAKGEERLGWLDDVRALDLALRGPRPAAGIAGLDAYFHAKRANGRSCARGSQPLDGFRGADLARAASPTLCAGRASARGRRRLARDQRAGWRQSCSQSCRLRCGRTADGRAEDAVPLLRQLLDERAVRPPYGGHPRIFIWGLLEARLQRVDLVVLGGLNEGVWPALPAPDPWLPPKVRADLGMPTLEHASALPRTISQVRSGAPEVLITRARRDAPLAHRRLSLPAAARRHDRRLPRDLRAATLDARARRSRPARSRSTGRRRARRPSSGPTRSRSPRSTV